MKQLSSIIASAHFDQKALGQNFLSFITWFIRVTGGRKKDSPQVAPN